MDVNVYPCNEILGSLKRRTYWKPLMIKIFWVINLESQMLWKTNLLFSYILEVSQLILCLLGTGSVTLFIPAWSISTKQLLTKYG